MSIATNYFENLVLGPLRGVPATAPDTVYVGLFLTNPGEAGGGTEVTGGSYARTAVTFGAPAESSAGVQTITNNASVTFPTSSSPWGTITYIGIIDASSGGNMLCYIQLDTPKVGTEGATISFVSGELRINASAQFTTYYKQSALNLFRGVSISAMSTYISLHTADPGESGSMANEVVATPYARQAVAWTTPAEQGNGNMTMTNTADVAFPRVGTVAWGAIPYMGICNAATGGNMLLRMAATDTSGNTITFGDGDRFIAAANSVTIFAA